MTQIKNHTQERVIVPTIHGALTVVVTRYSECLVCQSHTIEPPMEISEFEGIFGSSSRHDETRQSNVEAAVKHVRDYLGVELTHVTNGATKKAR